MTVEKRPTAKRPKPTSAARRKARGEAEGKSPGELVTLRLKPETVAWVRKLAEARGKSMNGGAQEILDCVRLHGFVPPGAYDELEADRKAHKYDPIEYQAHLCWRRTQAIEQPGNGPGFDSTSRVKVETGE